LKLDGWGDQSNGNFLVKSCIDELAQLIIGKISTMEPSANIHNSIKAAAGNCGTEKQLEDLNAKASSFAQYAESFADFATAVS
jgi:hypothetical protein